MYLLAMEWDWVINLGLGVIFTVIGAAVGIVMVMLASVVVPWVLNRVTPGIDEAGEIARGNRAVAEYFGRIASAVIIGISIVIAAAVLAGIIAALH